jgi:pyruvate dehydrogenase E2 component (dihydrolipoamide acetyltransferase)
MKPPAKVEGNGHGRVLASPFARKLALEKGVDLRELRGSGPRGRIVARDIETAAAEPRLRAVPAAPAPGPGTAPVGVPVPSREDQLIAPSQMRKTIARRLVEAKREIPHIYLTAEATVDKLVQLREQINEAGDVLGPRPTAGGAEGPVRVSINDLVVKAMALALRKVPEANVSWTAEGIVQHGGVHVGVAVSLPDGLITPVIRDADLKSIGTLARETKALAERARAKKLQPPEYSGGSATVSNLGMFGVRDFVAIINPPESVILAVGTTEKRAIVVEKEGRDEIVVARRMTMTLSCDHRVVDGVLGAKLLAEIVKLLEKPMGMLL